MFLEKKRDQENREVVQYSAEVSREHSTHHKAEKARTIKAVIKEQNLRMTTKAENSNEKQESSIS